MRYSCGFPICVSLFHNPINLLHIVVACKVDSFLIRYFSRYIHIHICVCRRTCLVGYNNMIRTVSWIYAKWERPEKISNHTCFFNIRNNESYFEVCSWFQLQEKWQHFLFCLFFITYLVVIEKLHKIPFFSKTFSGYRIHFLLISSEARFVSRLRS